MKKRTRLILTVAIVLALAAGAFAVCRSLLSKPLTVSVCAWAGTQHFPTEASTKTLADGTVVPAGFDKQGRMTLPAGSGPYSVTVVFDKADIMRSCPGLTLEEDRTVTIEFAQNSEPNLLAAELTLNLIYNDGTGSWLWRDELRLDRGGAPGSNAIQGEGASGTDTFYVDMGNR